MIFDLFTIGKLFINLDSGTIYFQQLPVQKDTVQTIVGYITHHHLIGRLDATLLFPSSKTTTNSHNKPNVIPFLFFISSASLIYPSTQHVCFQMSCIHPGLQFYI